MSAFVRARNVGTAAPPLEGPANTVPADCVAKPIEIVPDVVIGDPDSEKMAGTAIATELTLPDPDVAA